MLGVGFWLGARHEAPVPVTDRYLWRWSCGSSR
jgi:hypothetical protein